MKTVITGRKVNLKDNFKELAEKKLSKFDKLFDGNAVANVTVTVEKNRQTVEVTICHEGMVYRAESTTSEMNEALDKVMEALSRQFRKHKTKLAKRLRKDTLEDYLPVQEAVDSSELEEEKYKIVRIKNFPVKPLDVEEAILQMNMIGHQFYMFRNQTNGEVNVVYRRKNGDYGLLTPDAEQNK